MINKNLRERTPGEDLWLWRKHCGLSQARAAAKLGVGRTTYWTYETDQQLGPERPPTYRLSHAAPADLLRLARRRNGRTLLETARRVGCSHVTLLAREAAGDPALVAWWESRGYSF